MDRFEKHERRRMENGKHLMVETHTVSEGFPLHWHSYFEIELVLSGRGKYVINDVEYDISAHNMFFLTSTDFHYLSVAGDTRLINISFDEDMIEEKDIGALVFSQMQKAYTFTPEEYERLRAAAGLLAHECSIGGECQRQLLQYLLKCIFRKSSVSMSSSANYQHYRGIKKAIIYMEMHYKENITLQMLAAESGYHPTYFSELFKKVTGETYIEALTKLRLGCARTLLANGFSVSDACFLSGFGSLSNFFTAFKRHCKMSPREYRARSAAQVVAGEKEPQA